MLAVDTARVEACQVADELLVRVRVLIGVGPEDVQERLSLHAKPCRAEILRIFQGLLGQDHAPHHHSIRSENSDVGVALASKSDPRIPGMDMR